MATTKIQGNASGSGSVTVTAPNTNSNRTLTLPDADITIPNGLPGADAGYSKNVLTAQGDILYASGANTLARLAKGTGAQTLKMNAGATAPEWVTVAASATAFTSYAVFWDQKANNTAGGTASNGSWQVRDLNQEADPDGIASISTNVVTVAAGSYLFKWRCPAYDVNEHQSALYDVTNTTRYPGTGSYANAAETHNDYSEGIIRLTLGGSTEVRLEHQVNATSGGNGWGTAVNFSEATIYSILEIYKE